MSTEKEIFTEATESAFSSSELERMLKDKQIELDEARNELQKVMAENQSMTIRALKVHEENQMYKSAPELAQQMAQFEFDMKLADKFVKAGAFRVQNAEEAYILMKAGREMGLQHIESLQSLCIVNGSIDFYGDGRSSRMTKAGFRIEYLDEKENEVTVRVHNTHRTDLPEHEIIDVRETARDTDQILKRSKAMGFAKKNKLRWHALGMIQSFHLPHLFTSVSNNFNTAFYEYQKSIPERSKKFDQHQDKDEQERCLEWIEKADTFEKLLQVKEDAKQFELTEQWEEAAAKFNTDAKE